MHVLMPSRVKVTNLLTFILIASLTLFVVLAFCLLVAQQFSLINSDVLYSLSLYRDLFQRQIESGHWNLTPTPYAFPDLLGMFIAFSLSPDAGYAYTAYAAAYGLILCILMIRITRRVVPDNFNPALVSLSSLALFLLFLYHLKYQGMYSFLWAFATVHQGTILTGLLLLELCLALLSKPDSKMLWIIFFLLSFLGIFSDIIIVPQFILPIYFSFFILYRRQILRKETFRLTLKFFLLSGFLGVLFVKLMPFLGMGHIGAGVNHLFSSSVPKSFAAFVKDMPELWSVLYPLLISSAIWMLGTVIILRKSKSPKLLFISLFCLSSIPISFIAMLLNGRYSDATSLRQMQTCFILPQCFMLSFVWDRLKSYRFLIPALSSLLFLLSAASLGLLASQGDPITFKLPYPKEVSCVDSVTSKYGIHTGYGDYWTAKYVTELSRNNVWINQVSKSLEPYQWINNPTWYVQSHLNRSIPPFYEFIITKNLPRELIVQRFGEPAATEVCECCQELEFFIYNRSEDSKFRDLLSPSQSR